MAVAFDLPLLDFKAFAFVRLREVLTLPYP